LGISASFLLLLSSSLSCNALAVGRCGSVVWRRPSRRGEMFRASTSVPPRAHERRGPCRASLARRACRGGCPSPRTNAKAVRTRGKRGERMRPFECGASPGPPPSGAPSRSASNSGMRAHSLGLHAAERRRWVEEARARGRAGFCGYPGAEVVGPQLGWIVRPYCAALIAIVPSAVL